MPADYTIDVARRVVITRCWGRLTREDLVAYRERLAADPALDRTFCGLTDVLAVTEMALTADDVRWFGQSPLIAPGIPYAVVATGAVAYGLARMFQAHRELRGVPVEIFSDRESAERWLGLTEPET